MRLLANPWKEGLGSAPGDGATACQAPLGGRAAELHATATRTGTTPPPPPPHSAASHPPRPEPMRPARRGAAGGRRGQAGEPGSGTPPPGHRGWRPPFPNPTVPRWALWAGRPSRSGPRLGRAGGSRWLAGKGSRGRAGPPARWWGVPAP